MHITVRNEHRDRKRYLESSSRIKRKSLKRESVVWFLIDIVDSTGKKFVNSGNVEFSIDEVVWEVVQVMGDMDGREAERQVGWKTRR